MINLACYRQSWLTYNVKPKINQKVKAEIVVPIHYYIILAIKVGAK